MGMVEVEILDHTASKRRKAELPDDVPVEKILPLLITKLGLPTIDPSGQVVSYHLDHKQSGKRLLGKQTLKDVGVQNGDVLRILPRIEAGYEMRRRRLLNDYKRMERLREKNLIDFSSDGNPPERYKVRFSCRGLFLRNGVVANSILHEVEIYIPARYPLVPPELRWLTPIFHPNILGSDHPHYPGKVCLGGWSPSQFLDELCMKLIDMIEYRNYNVRSPINAEAAVWANRNEHLLPLSSRPRKKEPGIPIRFID